MTKKTLMQRTGNLFLGGVVALTLFLDDGCKKEQTMYDKVADIVKNENNYLSMDNKDGTCLNLEYSPDQNELSVELEGDYFYEHFGDKGVNGIKDGRDWYFCLNCPSDTNLVLFWDDKNIMYEDIMSNTASLEKFKEKESKYDSIIADFPKRYAEDKE